jgi:hypothetical protein
VNIKITAGLFFRTKNGLPEISIRFPAIIYLLPADGTILLCGNRGIDCTNQQGKISLPCLTFKIII